MTHPILDELIREVRRIESLKRDTLNAHSKLWRLQDNFVKAIEEFDKTIIKFRPFIEKEMNHGPVATEGPDSNSDSPDNNVEG